MNAVWGWIMGVLAAVIPGLAPPSEPSWNGYVEVDYTYLSATSAGIISQIPVKEGQLVKAGDTVFVLQSDQLEAQYSAAVAQVAAAEANLLNLQTGERPEEIEVVKAALAKAQSDLQLAQLAYDRSAMLFKQGSIPQSQYDSDKAALQSAQSEVNQASAQVKVSQLPARDAQQAAAQATLDAARANVVNAQAALDDRTVRAPAEGRIEKLFFRIGEVAPLGTPVASFQGSEALRVKFYVSQSDRQQFALGDRVSVSCDGCAAGLTATIDHFASNPEFTPPIIYSRDERDRLVFLVEATMTNQNGILPGQPVTVRHMP